MHFDLSTAHGWLRLGHVVPGFLGLLVFWIPLLTKKGGKAHKKFGMIFAFCAFLVTVSSMASCLWILLDPIGFSQYPEDKQTPSNMRQLEFFGMFLGTLSYYTFVPLLLSVRVIHTRKEPEKLGAPWVRGLVILQAIIGASLLATAIVRMGSGTNTPTDYVFIFLGFFGIRGAYQYWCHFNAPISMKMLWWYKHMEYSGATGIAFHTAFLVFGSGRLFGPWLTGYWQIIPWVLPALIGVPLLKWSIRGYQRKFGDLVESEKVS
jgi:hypothetical protein